MHSWDLHVSIDPASETPRFLQIAREVVRAIEEGRLNPGDALPATRALAQRLGVNRGTIVSAYQELQAEGWLRTQQGGGTYVAPDPPRAVRKDLPVEGIGPRDFLPGFLPKADSIPLPVVRAFPREVLTCHTGLPDHRLLPTASLARAYHRAMKTNAGAALKFGEAQGSLKLRTHLARMLSIQRGIPATPEHLLITQGAQMALYLVAQALFRPGDGVAVEALGNPHAWEAFRHAKARLEPIPVDEGGLCLEALEALLARSPIRALHLTPQRQYPTTVSLAPERRARLLALAERHRFAIIEDDYDAEFQFEGSPPSPLASLDRAGVVVFVGTLSKVFSPGLRLGYLWGPVSLVQHLAALRRAVDQQGDQVLELAVAELLEDGELQRHVLRMRGLYKERREHLADELRKGLGGALQVDLPPGGLAFWVRVLDGTDPGRWEEAALREGVTLRAGRSFSLEDLPVPAFRLGFAAYGAVELAQVARRLERAHQQCSGRPG